MKVDTSEAYIEHMADDIEPLYDSKDRGFCPHCVEYRFEKLQEVADALRALRAERDAALADAIRLREALQWMVDNDETNEGDEPDPELGGKSWSEINAYWIDGLNRARAALAGDAT